MIVYPNAKINLGLNVVRRRPDGYHDLETIFYPIPLQDALEVQELAETPTAAPTEGSRHRLRLAGTPLEGDPRQNLVLRAIELLEANIPNLYTPEGFYKVFVEGFLPVPYMMDQERKFPKARMWHTAIKNGGIRVIDDDGKIIDTVARYRSIISKMGE